MDATPSTQQGAAPTPARPPRLWNPNAAAAWSLFFSPVFGALLHMKNWEAMGEHARAAQSRQWAVGMAVAIGLLMLVSLFAVGNRGMELLCNLTSVTLLVAWYYGSGKAQTTRVLARFGRGYPRRGWVEPVLIAVAVLLALTALASGVSVLLALLDTRH
ncbi:hypothetical protein [Roseateles flavus]|uniref:Uncharacterized protein n=1 Tax=Roseateles flavus TaxID=3149041 RepID=A0ABV0GJS2_9BURK